MSKVDAVGARGRLPIKWEENIRGLVKEEEIEKTKHARQRCMDRRK